MTVDNVFNKHLFIQSRIHLLNIKPVKVVIYKTGIGIWGIINGEG